MRSWRSLLLPLLPPLVCGVLFLAVLQGPATAVWRRAVPTESFRSDRCNWYCHNHGCRHAPVLPAWLTSDRGLYGSTILGLKFLGSRIHEDSVTGYRIVNLLVFCVAWPGITYALWLLAIRQGRRLAQLDGDGRRGATR